MFGSFSPLQAAFVRFRLARFHSRTTREEAFRAGFAAYDEGWSKLDNPFDSFAPGGAALHAAWDAGYNAARS